MILAGIPSPSQGTWYLGPLPIRAYALFILAGIAVALWVSSKRIVARGGPADVVPEVAVWAVPFGVIGARIYHVVSSPDAYFGPGGHPVDALRIWNGGLGIWGAIALGAVGAAVACRRMGVKISSYADAAAPGIIFAQAIGRIGNYFNQELFGGPTSLPWGLMIDPQFRPAGYADVATFHPTFLYELLWNVAGGFFLLWLDRRFRLGHGRVFWAYVGVYTLGRVWIEALRIDDAERVLGLRLNIWTSLIVLALAVVMSVVLARRYPERETDVLTPRGRADADRLAEASPTDAADDAGTDEARDDDATDVARDDDAPDDAASEVEQPLGQEPGGEQDGEEAREPAHQAGRQEEPPAHPQ